MSLTIAGFAPPRTARLRGKGGNAVRRDNGVPPPATADTVATTATPTDYAATTAVQTRAATTTAAPADHTRTTSQQRRALRTTASTHASHKAPAPAAVEWEDARLPVVGRVWARVGPPLLLLAACLVLLMYLLETSGIATTGYDIQRLQVERDDWQLRNEQLQFELGKRRSLTWIEAYATEQLGMVRPEPTALTYVRYSR